jgi:hypothetical protein
MGMTEDEFTCELIDALSLDYKDHVIACKRSLLYELSIDDRGLVQMGVSSDTGEPIRGKGKGFEQDILIYKEVDGGQTSIVPRIVIEVKFKHVTTHDVIVYSEKADRIRRVYPYVRYGLILGSFRHIPGRVLRLGQAFDFVSALAYPFAEVQLAALRKVLTKELKTSLGENALLAGQRKPFMVHRALRVFE